MLRQWRVLPPPPQSFLEQFPELPPIVANLLYHRNIRDQKTIDEFLNPDYSANVHDPFLFHDMKKAVDRIFLALEKKERVTIHGDYDADGVSASIILSSLFKVLGIEHNIFLPHREIDGYGMNTNTIKNIAKSNTKLIITCDCGISNMPEIEIARELGMDVIVTDHHNIPPEIPPAVAIIHPNIPGETYPDKTLAGGGVAFKLAQGILQTHAKTNKTLPNGDKHESFEKWLLDMVAIATVGDMVPLRGESRTLTKYGLIVLNKTKRIGLQKMLLEARLRNDDGTNKKEISTDTISFQIAPRINAAGRMDHANVAFELLNCCSPTDAVDLAYKLEQNNLNRQKLTDSLFKEAVKQVGAEQMNQPVLFVIGEKWSTGIIGLIAGKVKEYYQKPTIAMSKNDEVTGSGRSVEGFDLIKSLFEMRDYFTKIGGHPMACGFTLKDEKTLEQFKTDLTAKFIEQTKGMDLTPSLNIDAEIDLEQVNWDLYDVLDKFKPFGQTNEQPKYLAKNLTVTGLEPVGKEGKHLRIMVKHKTPKIKKTIGWSLCAAGSDPNWCKVLRAGDKIDMVFEIDANEWNGNRELQLTIVDLKKLDV